MSLILTGEEQSLRDSVRRFVADRTPLTAIRELIDVRRALRRRGLEAADARQLGLAGLTIPEEYGGAGAGHAAMSVALQELGAGLVPSPLLASAVLAAGALLALDDDGGPRGAAAGHRQRRADGRPLAPSTGPPTGGRARVRAARRAAAARSR